MEFSFALQELLGRECEAAALAIVLFEYRVVAERSAAFETVLSQTLHFLTSLTASG